MDLLEVGLTMSNKRAYRSNDFGGKKNECLSMLSSRKSFSIRTEITVLLTFPCQFLLQFQA